MDVYIEYKTLSDGFYVKEGAYAVRLEGSSNLVFLGDSGI